MQVSIAGFTIDPQIQLTERRLDKDTVSAYVEALTNGDKFPPVIAFAENGTSWLADGFHRIAAARFLGLAEIEAEVRPGTKRDAMIYAALANATHGRPMSRAEKQEAGERLIKLTEWGNREIARRLACDEKSVRNWRGAEISAPENVNNSTSAIPGLVALICGSFDQVAKTLEPGSVDVIITDPPYPREFLPLYGMLAEQAKRLLKPGGSVLAMAGQSYLPEIFGSMAPHLTYHWMVSYLTPGGQAPQLWQRQVNTFWKPVLWFTNGKYQGRWVGDVVRSAVNDNDKRFHEWGQSESGMAELVEKFSQSGDLILDPFCGAGSTGVVALGLKRRFIGIDVDEKNIATTRQRLLSAVQDTQDEAA